jgi:hypothetical protein
MPFYRKSSTIVPERDMEDQPAYSVTQIDGVASELMDDAGDRRVESIDCLPRDWKGSGHCPKSIANLELVNNFIQFIHSIRPSMRGDGQEEPDIRFATLGHRLSPHYAKCSFSSGNHWRFISLVFGLLEEADLSAPENC